MFKRKHAQKDPVFACTPSGSVARNPLASRSVWIQHAIESLRGLIGLDRVAVWLEPELGSEDHASPIVFRGDIWESDGGDAPAEWTRLSGDAPLPQELLSRGKSVECQPSEPGADPMLGVLLGLHRALWVPVSGRKYLRGLILVGTRNKEQSIPRAIVEQTAAQLALLLEFEDERTLSAKREADLTLWKNVESSLASGQTSQIILKTIVESCTKPPNAGGVGAVFALIGDQQNGLPVVRPSAAAREDRLLVLAESGEHAWAHSVEQGSLETLWRQAITQGRVMGGDSDRIPLAKDISRIVAVPVECKTQTHAVLLAGLPRRHDALEMLERLELRALLVGQVMEVQRMVEAELREKLWQTALLDSSVESVSIVDRNGFLLGMSRGARELLRETENRAEETAGLKRFAELFRPRDWEEISGWIDRALAGSTAVSLRPLQTELPTGVPVQIQRLAISEPDFLAVKIFSLQSTGSAHGVKEVEEELRQSLEWLQEGVVIFDERGSIRALNSSCRRILGIITEVGQEIRDFDQLVARVSANASDSESFARNWRAMAAQGGSESREELTMEWPTPQLIERSMRPLVDEHGKKLGRVEVYQEFTARKIFHSRMLQTEKMASLGQRATGIVHELTNPLTTILGNAQRLVLRDPAAGSSVEVVRILEEAERASSILRQLLHISRETPPHRGHVSLHDLAERTIALQRVAIAESSIELRLESDDSLPPIDADFPQLQQVILNLLQNAQQAIQQSGKGSSIVVRTGRVDDDHVCMEVLDDGPGIPAAVQGRIYDPFFTTKPTGSGTGLGLSIALGFVRQNGGKLTHLIPKQGGTCFVMEFPVADGFALPKRALTASDTKVVQLAGTKEPLPAIGLERPRESAPRILVVEDEPTVAALIADVLRDGGLRVDVMLDSPSALRQIECESYDLLICDLKMPGLDGQSFYHAMLERHHPMNGKVLFVTGDVVAPRSQEFLARYHLPHVAKPFRMDELMQAVQDLLRFSQTVETVKAVPRPKQISGNG